MKICWIQASNTLNTNHLEDGVEMQILGQEVRVDPGCCISKKFPWWYWYCWSKDHSLSSKGLESFFALLSLSPFCSESWEVGCEDHISRLKPLTAAFGQ